MSEVNGDMGCGKKQKCDNGNDSDKDLNSFSSDSDAEGNVDGGQYDGQRALRSFAELICKTDITPEMVVADDFMRLMNWPNSLTRPSLEAVESECMKVYEEKKVKTKEILGNLDGLISLSLDILRSENDYGLFRDDYLCLSAHFIDENWKLKKWVLYFHPLFQSDGLFSKVGADWGISGILGDWGIENKIGTLSVTNDYCYEMVEFVKSHIQEKKGLQLGTGELFRVYCCEEIIMKMVQGAFDKIGYTIHKISRLCSFKTLFPLWYQTSSKLKKALELWSKGEFSSEDVMNDYKVPSAEEWKEVEGVCKIVESIYEVSNALFETKQLTANVYLYHLHEVREILTQMSTDSDDFVRTVAKDMLEKFGQYWDGMFVLLAIAAALDPRFKMKYVEFVCSKVKGVDGSSEVAAALGAIQKLFDEYVISFPAKDNCMSDSSSSDSDSDSEGELCVNHSFTVLQDYQQFIQSINQPAKSDLDCYLEEPVLPWNQDFNILTWWNTTGAKYPTLSRMARDFLAIPVSLATSYEAFYTEPRPVDERIISMKPELMNALMCARNWSHSH